jgi:hypothetical protein
MCSPATAAEPGRPRLVQSVVSPHSLTPTRANLPQRRARNRTVIAAATAAREGSVGGAETSPRSSGGGPTCNAWGRWSGVGLLLAVAFAEGPEPRETTIVSGRAGYSVQRAAAIGTSFRTSRPPVARSRSVEAGRAYEKTRSLADPLAMARTRTRTGDTTIFRESAGPVRRHKCLQVPRYALVCPHCDVLGSAPVWDSACASESQSAAAAEQRLRVQPEAGVVPARTIALSRSRASATLGSRTGSEGHAAGRFEEPRVPLASAGVRVGNIETR